MNEQGFVDRRISEWQRLTELCDRAEGSPSRLSAAEMREFVRLYRRVSTDLSIARTRSTNLSLAEYLNGLAGRAYGILYRAPRKPFWKSIGASVMLAAQTFRRRLVFVLISAAIFVGAGVFAFVALNAVPETRDYFIPAGFESAFDHWKSGRHQPREGGMDFAATGFYASNNPRAAIITGAIGAGTFGFGSIWLLWTNGALIGTLSHEVAPLGHLDFLYSSILPHGVPELSGIILAGAAGLLFGWALINPGRRSRGDALRAVSRDGVTLLATSVVLMFIAAPIEGFFSFNPLVPGWAKMMFATVEAIAWAVFWTSYGRREDVATLPTVA
jgi:uncharacterized membrane protein SpoIIM required for sporulation